MRAEAEQDCVLLSLCAFPHLRWFGGWVDGGGGGVQGK
jgi:hypothetical protein